MAISFDQIHDDYKASVSVQDYSRKPAIEGVKRIELKYFRDEGGGFGEIGRVNASMLEGVEGFEPRQVSYSYLEPGTIKAFHLHFLQTDVWFVPPEQKLLVGLHDVRAESGSYKDTMRFVMGAGRAELLVIPPGVAHGMANVWQAPSSVVYFTDQQFNQSDPDERRMPWDMLGAEFWEMVKG